VIDIDSEALTAHPFLALAGVEKSFDGQRELNAVDLVIEEGEFFTLLGPSGCGKTTLLRIIAGFERADRGMVSLSGRQLGSLPPERRPFNMVFQSYALFPHMTVAGNVAYGLQTAGVERSEVAKRVKAMLELVNLDRLGGRSVRELSGGQQQRVALARALVNEPEVLLLDEPLGALDLQLRRRLQEELRAIQSRLRTTFVYVTHDQEEALTMSHRIGVMHEGDLVQVGSPRDLYERPVSRFVAEFVGEANLLSCQIVGFPGRESARVRFADGSEIVAAMQPELRQSTPENVCAMIRPEHLEPVRGGPFAGRLRESIFLGAHYRHDVELADGRVLRCLTAHGVDVTPGEPIELGVAEGKAVVVAAGGQPSSSAIRLTSSNTRFDPTRAAVPAGSNGGATSTTSPATTSMPGSASP
jgi:spermidine/putrescine transport system ATP-binding protein